VASFKGKLGILATGIGGIAIGFVAAKSSSSGDKVSSKEPQYGTVAEFALAIRDLRATFSSRSDAVSTDPDDLQVHGFSMNDHHPGMYVGASRIGPVKIDVVFVRRRP
jgi:D-lactate dehydrogenase (cytochrome)